MQCPRCHTPITSAPDPGGHMTCPGCGARLLSRAARPRPAESASAGTPAFTNEEEPAAATVASAPARKAARPGADTAPSTGRRPARPAVAREEATPAPSPSPSANSLEQVLAEIRTLREAQQEILRLLQAGAAAPPAPSAFEGLRPEAAQPPVIRSRRRKSVLLIDDDPESRQAAIAAFEQADVPARAVSDGHAGVEAIAEQKPDVIVLELSLHGDMAGKDVINMIKATMEWVDIPIVLYTRAPVESQKEARTVHGADEVVLKQHGPTALVARVINLFRSR